MKINQCSLILFSLFSAGATAQNVELGKPDFYGSIRAQAAWHENVDYTTDIYQAEAGVIGMLDTDFFKARYQLEAEYSESISHAADDNDLMVREANIILMNPTFGGAFIGSGTTGTWADLYAKVDIFESNNMERHSDNLLLGGKRYATNQLAYITPHFGPFHFKAAIVSPDENNDKDADIVGLRALYTQGNFQLVVNQSLTSEEMMNGATEDSQRTIVATSYEWDNLYLGAVAEFDYDAPFGERNVYALSSKYQLNNTAFSLGYQFADWQDNRSNESLILANVHHDFNSNIAMFIEGALFEEKYQANNPKSVAKTKGDNINLGLIVSF
ncbi:porin [Vibrio ponticus]|uniref:Porin n=1 Tax=Vibrio ponticus TaxID=265668 RepID=A0A3N3E6E4_9VIBR|nr:porin [Vibrio ponticus]ROV62190.1 porin [Vibrio ponticus]